jgi:FtsP/CotA-like multicopper oxidase with cupredoxin domain
MQKSMGKGLLTPRRRELLKLGAVAGGSGFIASRAFDARAAIIVPPYTVPYLEALPVHRPKAPVAMLTPAPQEYPHADEAGRDPHQGWTRFPFLKTYAMVVKQAMHSFHPHLPTQIIWGYDGTLPGPTIVAYMGEPVIVRYYNKLPRDVNSFGSPEISTHLHNGHSASESDGYAGNYFSPTIAGPTLTRAGKYYDCHYPNAYAGTDRWPESGGDYREGLGTLWYHDHRENFTAANVYKGLSGFYLLFDQLDTGNEKDPSPTALRLPSGVGVYDIPLVIHNPKFDAGGLRIFDQFDTEGFIGNKITVNGKIAPFFKVASRKYRFRILNGSTSRFYDLVVRRGSTDLPFHVIANDGNLLPAPVPATSIQIAPAERIDIVVDFSTSPIGSELFLMDRIVQDSGRGPEPLLNLAGNALMRFDVDRTAADKSRVPSVLRPLPPIDLTAVKQQRVFRFKRENGVWLVNDQVFDPEKAAFKVKRGTAEIWDLGGTGGWHHPVHIHVEEGRILSRGGKAPAPVEAGRKDVYVLHPEQSVKVWMQFRDFTGKYMMHCHNLIHEDHSMMLRFDVED